MAHIVFVLGGARSGKSRHAETLARNGGDVIYLATAQARDEEMADRISRHKNDRPANWRTEEAPIDVAQSIRTLCKPGTVLIVDCLTLWLNNLFEADRDIAKETDKLIRAMRDAGGRIIVVSNEVGQGIVPDNALARQFRDEAGLMNQSALAAADEAFFMIAGAPLRIKPA
jgi:adenosylcobinamide kinase/adenosylcobinamide-phosphate guanylyltransferase